VATVTVSSVIERPAEEIFDLLADIRRNPEWCPAFEGGEKLTAGPVGPDAMFRTSMRGVGDLQIRITRYERPRRIWFTTSAKAAEIRHNFVLMPGRGGTHVEQEIDVRPRGVLRMVAPVMALILRRSVQSNTAGLKAYLESGAQAGACAPKAQHVETGT
jgi:Polyketide cyclase / dehydrase and lipid transport